MVWVVVRTYGNGNFMNSIYPVSFKYLSKAEEYAKILNEKEKLKGHEEKWVAIPLYSEEQAFN